LVLVEELLLLLLLPLSDSHQRGLHSLARRACHHFLRIQKKKKMPTTASVMSFALHRLRVLLKDKIPESKHQPSSHVLRSAFAWHLLWHVHKRSGIRSE